MTQFLRPAIKIHALDGVVRLAAEITDQGRGHAVVGVTSPTWASDHVDPSWINRKLARDCHWKPRLSAWKQVRRGREKHLEIVLALMPGDRWLVP